MNLNNFVLIVGGCGYIGSHAVVALIQAGYSVAVLDNLCNSSVEVLRRIKKITGVYPEFIRGDVRDRALLDYLFSQYPIDAVLHFAGLKAVGESSKKPLEYYDNNVTGTIKLVQAMSAAQVYRLVFSSSATVYGDPQRLPIPESHPIGQPTNPYGYSKLMIEQILTDLANADTKWSIALLRYFNPVGAHQSGLIGEDPKGIPNNLLPYISQVAVGKLERLAVYGDDYPTPDGTGVRDYIHVVDLALGHLRALEVISSKSGLDVWNLGTGQGYSVLEMIRAFEVASGQSVPYQIAPRRLGDIAICYADPSKAERELNWKASYNLQDMMQDAWRWQSMNPTGFNMLL